MTVNRRNFFKVLGVTGVALAVGKEFRSTPQNQKIISNFQVFYTIQPNVPDARHVNLPVQRQTGLPAPVGTIEAGVVRKTDESHRTVVNAFNSSKGEVYLKKAVHALQ